MNGPHLHGCSVPECRCLVPTHMLMCRAHWRRVPHHLQREVWDAWERYREGELSLSDLRAVQQRATVAVVARLGVRGAGDDAGEAKGGAA